MKKINIFIVGFSLLTNLLVAQSPLNSLHFDGTNDYVSSSLPTVFNDIANNDITLEAWIKPNVSNFSRVIFAQQNASNFVSISLGGSNEIYFYVSNNASQNTSVGLPIGVWSHVACTWDASTSQIEIYLNGVIQTTTNGGTSTTGTDNLMTIGARTNAAQFFQGELDEVRIWDIARTPCQISSAMSSEFTVSQANLVAYYNFNQGTAGGTNTGINTLPDFTTNYNGNLLNFNLTGITSNWISSSAGVTTLNQNNNYSSGTDTQTECNSYTWIDGNTYTANNNSATFNIVGGAANGCDSLVTLDLTIINAAAGTDTRTECNSYTWIDGNTYTANNNSATFNIAGGAANGCDSLVTLDLTINNVSNITTTTSGNTITSNNTNATYQWLDCDNNYAIILGETGQSYSATANGNYAVELTENGCVDSSSCVNITTVNIVENYIENALSIYPNPTNGKLTILFEKEFSNVQLTVCNVMGQAVLHKKYSLGNKIELTLEGAPGVYFIDIVDGDKRGRVKVIKE